MAQDSSNSLSETLDSSISLTDDTIDDHNPQFSSSSSSSTTSLSSSSSDPSLSRNSSFSRLSAKAPEFVPRSSSSTPSAPQSSPHGLVHVYPGPNPTFHVPINNGGHVSVPHPHHVPVQYHHPGPQYHSGGFIDRQDIAVSVQAQEPVPVVDQDNVLPPRNDLSEEAALKILNQVEYYFSDLNLATTDHLMKFINKDVEGYVPLSVVASFKKIKAVINSHRQLASILRSSNKLVVSEDGKKVKRHHPLTSSEMEELQSRIVVAENLPEDHCHQNLLKIFSAVGSVKTIRTCPPQTSNGGQSSASRAGKADGMLFSNKFHAFVEYESVELAERAVAELNDEANWRSGLRVRLLLRKTLKSTQARVKRIDHEGNANFEEDETSTSEQSQPHEKHLEDPAQQHEAQFNEHAGEENAIEKECGQKKGRGRGRGKGRGRLQYHHHNNTEQTSISKQPPGPRMPDGTRGFSMGRGKPIAVNIAS